MAEVIKKCRDTGYVTSFSGRKRYIKDINSKDSNQKASAERQAINTTIQGTASDIVKMAIINIRNELYVSQNHQVKFIHFIHDELLYEIPNNGQAIERTVEIIKNAASNACKLNVQLPVKVRKGISWGEMQ
jgi:DNA polymerase-1